MRNETICVDTRVSEGVINASLMSPLAEFCCRVLRCLWAFLNALDLLSVRIKVKEVIQPQVPLRLPCYDFTPVINHTVVTALLR